MVINITNIKQKKDPNILNQSMFIEDLCLELSSLLWEKRIELKGRLQGSNYVIGEIRHKQKLNLIIENVQKNS